MTIKEWNKQYTGMPCTHEQYMEKYQGFIMYNDEMGQAIIFANQHDVVETWARAGLYSPRDKYIYRVGSEVISFNSNHDGSAPWNNFSNETLSQIIPQNI